MGMRLGLHVFQYYTISVAGHTGCPIKNDPYTLFCQISITNGTFSAKFYTHTHVFNKDTHVDHFWCTVLKYTEYDNIFINYSLKFRYQTLVENASVCTH